MRSLLTTAFLLFCGIALSARAADLPEYQLTTPQAAQLQATTIIYQTIHTTITAQAEPIRTAMSALFAKLKAAGITPKGGPIFIYKTLAKDLTQPLDVEVAIPVADNTAAPEGCQSRVLPSTPTATAIFQGPAKSLNAAYPDFFRQLAALGKTPNGELRQRTLYFEDEASTNNVLMIEVEIVK